MGLHWPKEVGREFLLSGLFLADMNAELIDLENEAGLAGEDSWKRSEAPKTEPVSDSVFTLRQRLLRQSSEYVRSHDCSPLND
ncbi:MAG TPA: hypothetical protein VMQ67_09245 [Candidatus Saccharimonadales bacterium]|nr:hypothetical protein [Candidatus Saccharimonadales bacterium]